MVICCASFISREALHLTQYPLANAAPPDGLSPQRTLAPWLGRAAPYDHKTPTFRSGFVVRKGRVGISCCRIRKAASVVPTGPQDEAPTRVAGCESRAFVDRDRAVAWSDRRYQRELPRRTTRTPGHRLPPHADGRRQPRAYPASARAS